MQKILVSKLKNHSINYSHCLRGGHLLIQSATYEYKSFTTDMNNQMITDDFPFEKVSRNMIHKKILPILYRFLLVKIVLSFVRNYENIKHVFNPLEIISYW